MSEELNEDCGCQSTTDTIRTFSTPTYSRFEPDPLVGKRVNLSDGRSGLVDDSIRNNTGEVIGYVIEGDRGSYRVFKNKISGIVGESQGALASLPGVPGMGNVVPPTPGKEGSGDQFPSLSFGSKTAKGKKKDKNVMLGSDEKDKEKDSKSPLDTSLLNFDQFIKRTKKNQ